MLFASTSICGLLNLGLLVVIIGTVCPSCRVFVSSTSGSAMVIRGSVVVPSGSRRKLVTLRMGGDDDVIVGVVLGSTVVVVVVFASTSTFTKLINGSIGNDARTLASPNVSSVSLSGPGSLSSLIPDILKKKSAGGC